MTTLMTREDYENTIEAMRYLLEVLMLPTLNTIERTESLKTIKQMSSLLLAAEQLNSLPDKN